MEKNSFKNTGKVDLCKNPRKCFTSLPKSEAYVGGFFYLESSAAAMTESTIPPQSGTKNSASGFEFEGVCKILKLLTTRQLRLSCSSLQSCGCNAILPEVSNNLHYCQRFTYFKGSWKREKLGIGKESNVTNMVPDRGDRCLFTI